MCSPLPFLETKKALCITVVLGTILAGAAVAAVLLWKFSKCGKGAEALRGALPSLLPAVSPSKPAVFSSPLFGDREDPSHPISLSGLLGVTCVHHPHLWVVGTP